MKILFLTTFEKLGGAGLAAHRLYRALKNHTSAELSSITQFGRNYRKYDIGNIPAFARIGLEKFMLRPKLANPKDVFKFETGKFGMGIDAGHPLVNWADILHLHMTTQGFISLEALAKLAGTKPIVWTLHDMWPFTGGCVYSFDCDHFKDACGNCPFLKPNGPADLSNRLWEEKKNIFEKGGFTFVAPSQWMADKAAGSSIGKFTGILKIHNTIDTDCFCPSDKSSSRELLGLNAGDIPLLFGAQNIDDERKGFYLLRRALEVVNQMDPEYSKRISLLVFGATKNKTNFDRLPVRVRYFGSPANTREIIHLYRAALYYIHCATADNLPNTVVESLSCGTPVIAFNSGGVSELVQAGYNGFLTDPGNEQSLADTILKAIKTDQDYKLMAENARIAAVQRYSMKEISGTYFGLYEKVLHPGS